MAIAVGDIYQAVLRYEYQSQDMSNVFWYKITTLGDTSPIANSLWSQIVGDLVAALISLQHVSVSYNVLSVVNWGKPGEDYYEADVDAEGVSAGEGMPPFVTASFRSARNFPGQRYSYKRFGGIGEGLIANGVPASPPTWGLVAAELGAVTTFPNGTVIYPGQVAHSVAGVSVLPGIGEGTPIWNYATNGAWSYFVGSQNSRKF